VLMKMRSFQTKRLAVLAFLIAMNVILARVLSINFSLGGVEGIRIGFGALPTIMAGFLFGPVFGAIAGAVGDVLGYLVKPLGPYMPHFTFTALLTGMIPALIVNYLFKGKRSFSVYLIAIATGQLISSVILVPYFMQMLFSIPRSATQIPYIVSQSFNVPIYAYLNDLLIGYLQKGNLVPSKSNS